MGWFGENIALPLFRVIADKWPELFRGWGDALRVVFLIAFGYGAGLVWYEGSFRDAWRAVAYSKAFLLQEQLSRVPYNDALIDRLMQGLLSPGVARIRLAVIHDGQVNLIDSDMFRFDISHGVAAPGRSIGPYVMNQPMKTWSAFLPDLLDRKCVQYATSDLAPSPGRQRVESMGVAAVTTCPVTDSRGNLLGVLFTEYDSFAEVPPEPEMNRLKERTKVVGTQIAVALDLRTRDGGAP